jgi:hypothetical protein
VAVNAADLISLASAKGVNLVQAAQMAATEKAKSEFVTVRVAPGRFAKTLRPQSPSEAKGRASRSYSRKPTWTTAELSQASQGLAPVLFDAALYHYACDATPYWRLFQQLVTRAYHLQAENDWPGEIRDVHGIEMPYIRHLAMLVLDEDQSQALFKLLDGALYPIYMNCWAKTWDSTLSGPYEDLRQVWLGWLHSARAHIGPRLREGA